MRIILGLLVFGCVEVLCVSAAVLPKERSVRFSYFTHKVDWITALQECERQHKRLATIMSKVEYDMILANLTKQGLRGQSFWVGGTDFRAKGFVDWVGERDEHFHRADYSNWMADQPNPHQDQGCLQLENLQAQWRIQDCRQTYNYICEEDSTS